MKQNPKQKKWMLIAGGAVICIVLAVAIGSRFRKQPGAGDVILPEETEDTRIILADLPHRVDIELERTEGESDDHEAEEPEVVVRAEAPGGGDKAGGCLGGDSSRPYKETEWGDGGRRASAGRTCGRDQAGRAGGAGGYPTGRGYFRRADLHSRLRMGGEPGRRRFGDHSRGHV